MRVHRLRTILGLACAVALVSEACSSGESKKVLVIAEAGAAGANAGESPGGQGGATAGASGAAGEGGANAEASEGGAAGQAEGATGGAPCLPLRGMASDSAGAGGAEASVVLYSNDFETPNEPLQVNCGNSLDARGINTLYGTQDFVFAQVNTVEGVVIHDPSQLYSDPSGIGKNYALGMLATFQDDMLALTFKATGQPFLNVGFDLSAIDVQGCGGPFGTAVPVMQVSLLDTPSGTFDFGTPGTVLDRGTVTGVASSSPWTFDWTYGIVSLAAGKATGKSVTVVFDLKQSGYASFDNLSIVSSRSMKVVDSNNDGIPDDQECKP